MPAVDTFISPLSFSAVKLEATLAEPTQFRADAERLSHIIMEMQRCFLLHLCKELAPGNVSFSQYFLLAALDQKEVLTMSAIAQKMGHTTAAASGLVARLENLGYVTRASGAQQTCLIRRRFLSAAERSSWRGFWATMIVARSGRLRGFSGDGK